MRRYVLERSLRGVAFTVEEASIAAEGFSRCQRSRGEVAVRL